MTNALNLTIIEGRLVRRPDLRQTTNGTPFTTLNIAVNEFTKVNGKYESNAMFLPCTVWGKIAEYCTRYLIKGQIVRIKGKLHQSSWTDKNGETHSKVELSANNVEFLAKPKNSSQTNRQATEYTESVPF